jgi:hypothetical protein
MTDLTYTIIDGGSAQGLPAGRHADRRTTRPEGRQGRNELGLTAMTETRTDFTTSPAPTTSP